MPRVYLETSFFSACVSTRKNEQSVGWRASSNEWWRAQRHHHELFISAEVINELSVSSFKNGKKAIEMVRGVTVLETTNEIESLASLLVDQRVMPHPALAGDAMHVAAATIYRMDYLLTWNIKHLANPNKRTHFAILCMRLGLVPPLIWTPDMLME